MKRVTDIYVIKDTETDNLIGSNTKVAWATISGAKNAWLTHSYYYCKDHNIKKFSDQSRFVVEKLYED